ncbi:hypothetical protein H8356DRAFT_513622 [Neocallimastix lanati (nom. inval.)]|nr:hypothetical protein H8356DRAFT_513622 [Neocallimastix sp. JGI-2020a]
MNDRIIWNYLKNHGFNDYATAGIMGNLRKESELSPTKLEICFSKSLNKTDEQYTREVDQNIYKDFVTDKAGYGLAQWTYWTRKQGLLDYAKQRKVSIGDLNMQLDYLYQEIIEYKEMVSKLEKVKDVRSASSIFMLDFEKPVDQSKAEQNRRANFALEYYNKFATGNTGNTGSNTTVLTSHSNNSLFDYSEEAFLKFWNKIF